MTPDEQFIETVRGAMPCCANCEHVQETHHEVMDIDGNFIPVGTVISCGKDPAKRQIPLKVLARGCPSFDRNVPF